MVKREFLDWNRPLCDAVADWLLSRPEEMAGFCVIVPTTQSARRLRDRILQKSQNGLLPTFTTPSEWFGMVAKDAAPAWLETLAWCEVLEGISDWTPFRPLFPETPDFQGGALHSMARELRSLAQRLQENGHTFASAASAMAQSYDAERWKCLAVLEHHFRSWLEKSGLSSRSDLLAGAGHSFLENQAIILAGIADMPPWLATRLTQTSSQVTALIGAPSSMADSFDELGLPRACWAEETMPWPGEQSGSVQLAVDGAAQIRTTLSLLEDAGTPSDKAAIGAADSSLAGGMAEMLTKHGWPAFDPSPASVSTGLRRWLGVWRSWLVEESVTHLHDLLSLPESQLFASDRDRVAALEILGQLRDQRLVRTMDDLLRVSKPSSDRGIDPGSIQKLATAASQMRETFLNRPFHHAAIALLDEIQSEDPDAQWIRDWCAETQAAQERSDQTNLFWLDLLISSLPPIPSPPPDDRVIDVLGWLELSYTSAPHLIVCGMNEGKVPATIDNHSWLGEKTCQRLGLPTNAGRAARDAFLARQLHEARRSHGRMDWICGKFGTGGTSLLPSRILLQAHGAELADRVRILFRDIPPTEAGIRKQADWKWMPHAMPAIDRISVTALRDWIDCPFRFYLKHVVKIQKPDHDRIEWNHRDFGNLFHDVAEAWANDEEARDFNKVEPLARWLSNQLDRIVAGRFGKTPSLAIRMQTESLRSRLEWFARAQAMLRADGWRTIAAERKMELPLGGLTISGKIDRIDLHPEEGLRVIDYKTSSDAKNVVSEHLAGISDSTRHLTHWGTDSPIFLIMDDQGKTAAQRWKNLQLPLYAAFLLKENGTMPTPCYIGVGASEKQVKVQPWHEFSQTHLDSALACAEWIVSRIREAEFWPPAGKAPYQDDPVDALSCGWPEEEMFVRPENPHGAVTTLGVQK